MLYFQDRPFVRCQDGVYRPLSWVAGGPVYCQTRDPRVVSLEVKMRRIIIAAILLGIGIHFADAGSDGPDWRTVGELDGVAYIADYHSIIRTAKTNINLPTQARITVYRHAGGEIDKRAFMVMRFDCKGRFGFWDDPASMERIKVGSIASGLEDAACWGGSTAK